MLFSLRELVQWLGFATFEIFVHLLALLVFSVLLALRVDGLAPTSHSGELKGLTDLCRRRPCWTKAGKAAHSQAAQGGTGVSGWRPFAGSCSGSSVLPEAPGAGHLDCTARGLRRPNARGPGTASSI